MCGIYLTNIPYAKKKVTDKLRSIRYRGPDYTGITKVDEVTMGHLRLSILDLDPRSHQPMVSGHFHIVFNGEIYNFKELRKELELLGEQFRTQSDTEVLLVGYRVWRADLLSRLNGMFAFSIYDSKNQTIFSARDRLGQKPLYYYWNNGKFEICSQLRPLVENRELNQEAISMYLDCRYIPSPYSILKDVFKLPPGNYMEIDLNAQSLHIHEYWNLKKINPQKISYAEAKKKLHDLLKDAVKIRLQADVPIGAFLSGGIDSALIASIATEVSSTQLNTFCIGFDEPEYDESEIAAKFSKIIESNHSEAICTSKQVLELIPKMIEVFDEPFADSSALPSLLLNSRVKEHVTVALSGDGGDESFLGYNHFDFLERMRKLFIIPFFVRSLFARLPIARFFKNKAESLKNVLCVKEAKHMFKYVYIGFKTLLRKRDLKWLKFYERYLDLSTEYLQKAADFHIKLWLENDSNTKVDRASMAYSVEVRSPFLDYRIVEFARTLPVSYRHDKKRKKKILRDILKTYIPENFFDQPKSGFSIPLGKWIRSELRNEFQKALDDAFLQRVPNLDVVKFKKQFQDHLDGKADHATNIWKLYVLSKWYDEFGF